MFACISYVHTCMPMLKFHHLLALFQSDSAGSLKLYTQTKIMNVYGITMTIDRLIKLTGLPP